MQRLRIYGLFWWALACSSGAAFAQAQPDAGSLQEQIEREFKPLPSLPMVKPPEKEALPVAPPREALRVVVKGFRFQGNTLVSTEDLAAQLTPEIGKALTLEELRALTNKIAAFYRGKGWIARVVLPPQELTDGEVTFQIIESVLGEVSIQGSTPTRVAVEQIEARLLARQRIGEPLSTRALDRAVLIADDLPGVRVQGSYVAGSREGETRYVYQAADEPWLAGDVKLDNQGSRSTGPNRFAATLIFNSPFQLADQWQASIALSEGSQYARIAASLPLGADGWRAGFNGSWLQYKVVTPEFSALALKGSSNTFGVDLNYPIVRSARENLYFSISAEQKQFFNESSFGTLSDYSSSSSQIGLSWNRMDRLWLGGSSFGQLSLAGIRLHNISSGPQAQLDRHVSKLRYGLGRQQTLGPDLSLLINLSGQWTARTLDSSEKFSLGGASGVRAYPSGEGSGSRANLVNTEARWSLSDEWGLSVFYDWGKIKNLDQSAGYALEGAGLSLNFMAASGGFFSAVWSRRIGTNPNPSDDGKDQDGSLKKHRLWLSAGWKF